MKSLCKSLAADGIIFDKSFEKSLDKIKENAVKLKIVELIDEIDAAASILDLNNFKKLRGFKNYYRFRVGDYRIGIELEEGNILRLIIVLHRKDIYKRFP